MTQTRRCKACTDNPGESVHKAFSFEGKSYPERRQPCFTCKGVPDMPEPDAAVIRDAIKGRPKAGRQALRSTRPDDARAYYVWRWARFHGGADVTLPMSASMGMGRDPWLPELGAMAEQVACQVYGSDMAGAHRWGRALGTLNKDLPGLPQSAYSNGPVADEDKPIEETPELW